MKKILIIITLITFFINSSGQSYRSVTPTDSTSWDICHYELFGILKQHLFAMSYIDSIYSHLYFYGSTPDTSYIGKIREDADLGLLWYTGIEPTNERLIMNMNLSVSDSFQIFNDEWAHVDSIYYKNSRKVIRFDLHTRWDEPVLFIEGIGPNISVLYTIHEYDWFYVSCKYDKDSLVYVNSNSLFDDCDPVSTGVPDRLLNSEVRIYPIPAKTHLNIEVPGNQLGEIEVTIRNIAGMVEYYNRFKDSRFSIPINALPQGVYIISFLNERIYCTKKILKTN